MNGDEQCVFVCLVFCEFVALYSRVINNRPKTIYLGWPADKHTEDEVGQREETFAHVKKVPLFDGGHAPRTGITEE